MTRYNDNQILIAGLKQGEKEAYEFLFRKYYASLCHYAERYVKDSVAAEDIVAQVFCNLFVKRKETSIQSIQPYLFFSVRNSALNYLRDQKTFVGISDAVDNEFYNPSNPPELNLERVNPLLHKEADKLLENAITMLPPQCRKIFLLSRDEQLTYKEIAEKLDISVNTVETQMSRAIKKLSGLLGGYLKLFLVLMAGL